MIARRTWLAAASSFVAFALAIGGAPRLLGAPPEIPSRLSDTAFWRMIVDFSEPGGFFRSDNLVSNETEFQHVIPELQRTVASGGVYLGVGPDQNFTYISALEPKMSFILDIRRQNMLLHLMYKALLEQSSDRAEFLSRLFSRKRPPSIGTRSTSEELFAAYRMVQSDDALFEKNLRSMIEHLTRRHKFPLGVEDIKGIEYVYRAFYRGGAELRYSYPRFSGYAAFPAYGELMMETDGRGEHRSYLANENNYRALRTREQNNLIVPLVGNFAGEKAMRAIGQYLRQHGATVTVFYTSNVEQYLFQTEEWRAFFTNVGTLPLEDSSTFIRSYFTSTGYRAQTYTAGLYSTTLLDSIANLLASVHEGQIQSYRDVIDHSR